MTRLQSVRDGVTVGWNALIRDVTKGQWRDPDTGVPVEVPFRHVEIGVPIPADVLSSAIEFLEGETLDWEGDADARGRRRERELASLRGASD